jgi:Tfp pilus assembly protein PilO
MELYTFDGDFDILNVKKSKKKKTFKNSYEKKRYKVAKLENINISF